MEPKHTIRGHEASPGNFPVEEKHILYSDNLYAIAINNFQGAKKYTLGIRWQTEGAGYPKSIGHPMWMIMPDELAVPILSHILNNKNENENEVNHARITDAMRKLKLKKND